MDLKVQKSNTELQNYTQFNLAFQHVMSYLNTNKRGSCRFSLCLKNKTEHWQVVKNSEKCFLADNRTHTNRLHPFDS